jgi:hypothetical protein
VDIIKLLLDKEMSVYLTQNTLQRYMFQPEMAIWKQRKLLSKDLLLSTILKIWCQAIHGGCTRWENISYYLHYRDCR